MLAGVLLELALEDSVVGELDHSPDVLVVHARHLGSQLHDRLVQWHPVVEESVGSLVPHHLQRLWMDRAVARSGHQELGEWIHVMGLCAMMLGMAREMGSKFRPLRQVSEPTIPIEEAARRLDLNPRTVYSHIYRGRLRAVKSSEKGKSTHVLVREVEELLAAKVDPPTVAMTPLGWARMEREVAQIRADLDTVLAILDARRAPLNLTDQEALSYYRMGQSYTKDKNDWPPHIEPN